MPTLSFLSDKSQSFASSRMASYLENSDSLEDFDAHFKADLSDYLSGFYGKEAVVKNRVKHNVEKNLLYQDFSDHYIPGGENKKISPTETPEANKLMTLMYNTIDNNDSEYSNTQDIQRFHTILDKLAKLAIDDEQTQRPNLETSRKEFLSGLRDDS
ncbi:hypothetical protein KKG31_06040 [Patescibacteria group bacterium]|nr:hypothetical protein [Patescibacteria group bacterium]MBU1758660.1 hypothetical protein [Patescibacteria group bacterium]